MQCVIVCPDTLIRRPGDSALWGAIALSPPDREIEPLKISALQHRSITSIPVEHPLSILKLKMIERLLRTLIGCSWSGLKDRRLLTCLISGSCLIRKIRRKAQVWTDGLMD